MVEDCAPPGKELKYARPEYERRFLLAVAPTFAAGSGIRIDDRYLIGTRIRLRRTTEIGADTGIPRTVHKLTQKVPGPDGVPGLITTFYLDADEYAVLAAVAAHPLHKVRHRIPPMSVDVFDGPLAGLVLAEVELDDAGAVDDFVPPPDVIAEVTADPRLTGGRLALSTASDVRSVLADYGVVPPR